MLTVQCLQGPRMAIIQAASANQNVTGNIQDKKLEEQPQYLAHQLKHINKAKDWWNPNNTF